MMRAVVVVFVLAASVSASAQVIDRDCFSALDETLALLAERSSERDELRRELGLAAAKPHPTLEGDCEEKRARAEALAEAVRLENIELRERRRIRLEREPASKAPAARASDDERGVAETGDAAQLQSEIVQLRKRADRLERELKRERARERFSTTRGAERRARSSAEQPLDVDLSSLQMGIVLTSIGGGFVINAVLSLPVAIGMLVFSQDRTIHLQQQQSLQVSAAALGGAAVVGGALGGALLYLGRVQLDEAFGHKLPGGPR